MQGRQINCRPRLFLKDQICVVLFPAVFTNGMSLFNDLIIDQT